MLTAEPSKLGQVGVSLFESEMLTRQNDKITKTVVEHPEKIMSQTLVKLCLFLTFLTAWTSCKLCVRMRRREEPVNLHRVRGSQLVFEKKENGQRRRCDVIDNSNYVEDVCPKLLHLTDTSTTALR